MCGSFVKASEIDSHSRIADALILIYSIMLPSRRECNLTDCR